MKCKLGQAIFLYLSIVLSIIFFRVYFEKWLFKPLNKEAKIERVITVENGDSLHKISYDLKNQGIISFIFPFKLFFRLKHLDGYIKPGIYVLNSSMNFYEIAGLLSQANNTDLWITIPEGYTIKQIDNKLFNLGLLKYQGEFWDYTQTYLKDRNYKINIDGFEVQIKSLEGFLFPDTYRLRQGDPLERIINKFLSNFNKKLQENHLLAKIQQKKLDFYSVVKIASILEKEVKSYEEKRLVSDIIWRRLETNMLLQIDATLNYILVQKKPILTLEDLDIDSPYNSYKYKGLPPTPISNPGLESFLAVLNPRANDYWFYISDLKTGHTYFSKNFEDHKKLKLKLLNF